MNEMIDRCRVAVVEALQGSDLPVGTYIDSEKIVRAVIEAMREPSEKMKLAGGKELPDYDPSIVDATNCWQAMIDAALSNKKAAASS